LFRLALAIGCTVGELLDRVDSRELTEWMAFDAIEPIGSWRDDYNSGMLCSLLANINRRKGAAPIPPQAFMPFMPKEEDFLTDDEKMLRMFQGMAANMNRKGGTA